MKPKPLTMRWFAVVAMAVVLVDQATKILAIRTLRPRLPGAVDLIPRALALRYAENRGAAWSMLQEHPLFLTAVSTVVAVALFLWAIYLKPDEVQLRWPLALILGGAVGNLIDRYLLGHVTDFIDVHWDNAYHFPTFNVADSAICVGMGILILMSFAARPVKEDEAAPDAPGSGP